MFLDKVSVDQNALVWLRMCSMIYAVFSYSFAKFIVNWGGSNGIALAKVIFSIKQDQIILFRRMFIKHTRDQMELLYLKLKGWKKS